MYTFWFLLKYVYFKTSNLFFFFFKLETLFDYKFKTDVVNYQVRSVKFDSSGAYLAIGGSDTRVYLSKQWAQVAKWDDHQEICTGVQFGPNASYLATTSMDRKLRIYK